MSEIRHGIDPTRVTISAEFPVGLEVDDPRSGFTGNRIKYVRAQSAIALGDAVMVDVTQADEPGSVVPTTGASVAGNPVDGIAHIAIASGSFGWITVKGRVPSAKVAAGTVAGAQLGAHTAAAGTLQTITVTVTYVADETRRAIAAAAGRGVVALDAESGGLAEVYIS